MMAEERERVGIERIDGVDISRRKKDETTKGRIKRAEKPGTIGCLCTKRAQSVIADL